MSYQISYPASLSRLRLGQLRVSSSSQCTSASLVGQTSSHFSPWVGATTPGHTRQDHHKCHVIDQLLSWQLAESANVGGEVHICPSLPSPVAHYFDDFGPSTLLSTRDPPFSGAGELSKDPELAVENGGQRFFDENGQELDPTFLDVTDRVNQAFRYPLSSEVRSC